MKNNQTSSSTPLLFQIGILFAICLAGEWIALLLPIPFPGSVAAMLLLLLLLLTGLLKVGNIRTIADFMLSNMSFFFIPAGISILEYIGLLRGNLLPILAVCVCSFLITFGVTALTVKLVFCLQRRGNRKEKQDGSLS